MKAATRIALVSLLAVAGGCRTTVQAGHVLTPESERIIRENQVRAPLEVVVPVGPAHYAEGEIVRVLPDQQAVVRLSDRELSVPVAAIRRIDVTDRAAGAIEGMGIGILAGAVLGMALGAQHGPDETFTRADTMLIAGAVLGVVGGLVGVVVGGVRGDVTSYHFQ